MKNPTIYYDYDLLFALKDESKDKAALKQILKRYSVLLLPFIYIRIGNLNVCETLVSEVFLDLWDERLTIDPYIRLDLYLFKKTKDKAIAYIEKEKPKKFMEGFKEYRKTTPFNPEVLEPSYLEKIMKEEISNLSYIFRKDYESSRLGQTLQTKST
ncbi:hypothetical protein ABDJ41_16245 [Pedobacter sp. ASV1-7]|uniref:hypothetical protein n=1 Tax=Pedobacter sp. ASV1-7 TaxID=3145237 RepID=UPI0032E89CB9